MNDDISLVAMAVPPSQHPSDDVVELHAGFFCSLPWNMKFEKVRSLLQTIYDSPGFYGVFAYDHDRKLAGVGLATTEEKEGGAFLSFKSLAVSQAFHGKKVVGGKSIGRVLAEKVIEEGHARGLSFVKLATRRGGTAETLYNSLGFKDEPCGDPEWRVMRYNLLPCSPSLQKSSPRQHTAGIFRTSPTP